MKMKMNSQEDLNCILLLFVLISLIIVCLLHCWWFCYLYQKRQTINIDSPPTYDEVVLCEKELPKFLSIE